MSRQVIYLFQMIRKMTSTHDSTATTREVHLQATLDCLKYIFPTRQ